MRRCLNEAVWSRRILEDRFAHDCCGPVYKPVRRHGVRRREEPPGFVEPADIALSDLLQGNPEAQGVNGIALARAAEILWPAYSEAAVRELLPHACVVPLSHGFVRIAWIHAFEVARQNACTCDCRQSFKESFWRAVLKPQTSGAHPVQLR